LYLPCAYLCTHTINHSPYSSGYESSRALAVATYAIRTRLSYSTAVYQAISAPTTCLSCYYTCYSHLPSRISVRGRYLHLAADFKQDQCTRTLPKSCQLRSAISVRGRYLHLTTDFKQDQCTRALPKSCQLRSAYEGAIYILATSKSFPVCTRAHLTQNLSAGLRGRTRTHLP
jgi:hypothetical protein